MCLHQRVAARCTGGRRLEATQDDVAAGAREGARDGVAQAAGRPGHERAMLLPDDGWHQPAAMRMSIPASSSSSSVQSARRRPAVSHWGVP